MTPTLPATDHDAVVRRLASIVEFSDDAIIGKDLDSTITSWNRGAEKLFGYTADEIVGRSILRLFPRERWEEEELILGKIRQGASVDHFETVRQHKSGRRIDVSVTVSPIKDGAGIPIGVSTIARDISARLRGQARLKLLDTCVANLNDIVMVTDADFSDESGPRILLINPVFERITGYSAEEMVGRSPRFLDGPGTDGAVVEEIRQAMREFRPIRRTLLNYGKQGGEYWLDIDLVPIFDAAGQCTNFVAIERDITQERRVQEQLRSKTALFEAHINSSPDGILVVDLEGNKILQNECMARMWNIPREFAIAVDDQKQREWVTGWVTDPQQFAAQIDHLMSHPYETSRDQISLHDGRTFDRYSAPVKGADGTLYGRIWSFRDISDQIQSAALISEQAALLDKARDAILVRDLEGTILFWNQGAERLYGWTSAEAVGKYAGTLLNAVPERFTEIYQKTLAEGEWHGEIVHRTKNGRELTVEARWTLIRDHAGNPKSVLAINTDITERKKLEAQFLRAQRMESIGTLAGGIAHDLNNILSPIMMSIDMLKLTANDRPTLEILDTIDVSAKRGADIVRQVLSFARGLESILIKVQAKTLLRDLESIIKDTFPKDIRLQFKRESDTWPILGDPTQLHQVLLNLAVNARDAMPHGGALTIEAKNVTLDEQYAAMNLQAKPGRYVQIAVTDTGTGMSPAILEKIFDPFFTTKDLSKGTGLGLATVLAIVKSHAGIINVYSELGKGTTFRVYLPAMLEGPEDPAISEASAALPRGSGETILLVDDEASIITVTGQTLQAFGYTVLSAADGAQAVAVYAVNRDRIAAVVTDMMMPIMDGTATIHALKRINPQIKIVAASGLNSHGNGQTTVGLGIKHFLAKPYTAGTLLTKLRAILDEP